MTQEEQKEKMIGIIQDSVGGCARHWAEIIANGLLENGMLAPPCKIGETVFIIHTLTHQVIVKCVVDALHFSYGRTIRGQKRYSYALVREADLTFLSSRIYFENFGKTAFLSLEEAEAALKEREGNL